MIPDALDLRADAGAERYTHLFACISEEDGGFIVQVRLYNELSLANAAWGEEIADSLETASMLVTVLAAEFSIPPERIKLELRMSDVTAATQH